VDPCLPLARKSPADAIVFLVITQDICNIGRPTSPTPKATLVGRKVEWARIEALLQQVRAGRGGGVLIVRGEHGIGKTVLLDDAVKRAEGFRVIRLRGIEAEMELPYAWLHLLTGSMTDCIQRLDLAEKEALEGAIGFGRAQPDRFAVGLATAALLSGGTPGQPLLCIVDDAQWLDRPSAQALAFAARRLESQPVAILLAERGPHTGPEFSGLPELLMGGLSPAETRMLLHASICGRADETVIDRIVTETRGNPGVLLELLNGVSTAGFAGGFGAVTAPRAARAAPHPVVERMEQLPTECRHLLLLAAADAAGDPALFWQAASHLGLSAAATGPLESLRFLQFGPRVTFCDPSVRSAIYGSASNEDRRAVHKALADASRAAGESDWCHWHLAHAAVGADEELAVELERCVPTARERGGPAAAAAFLEKAATLTLDSARRSRRALAAAAAKVEAGAPDAALRLLVIAETGALDPALRVRLHRQRAQTAFAAERGGNASQLLLDAAHQLQPHESRLASETFLEAMVAAIFAGRLGHGTYATAKEIRTSLALVQPSSAREVLLRGLVVRFTEGYAAARPILKQALEALRPESKDQESSRWLWLGCRVAADLWDDESWHALTSFELQRAKHADALTSLPYALTYRAIVDVHSGEFDAAEALVGNADAFAEAAGQPPFAYTSLILAAWRGQETRALDLLDAAREDASRRGEGVTLTTASYAAALLYNGLGRYEDAWEAASDAVGIDELGLFGWSLVELVEAAARTGKPSVGMAALERLEERARIADTDWALGMAARSRALLSESADAEALYMEAIERLQRTRIKVHLARAQLIYGEWLRRQGRRVDARPQLRMARESFVAMGAEAFAERAHRELLATGETVRRRSVASADHLTPQETRIALLAREGLTNPDIGQRLFVSPRTVEYHLHKVFEKFGITSRRELHLVLDDKLNVPGLTPTSSAHEQRPRISPASRSPEPAWA
jgi:DNA-binding CsgD family transcriptional regulator/tetratricopeptide (TPR) repeat protein